VPVVDDSGQGALGGRAPRVVDDEVDGGRGPSEGEVDRVIVSDQRERLIGAEAARPGTHTRVKPGGQHLHDLLMLTASDGVRKRLVVGWLSE
jgi:hypothetical protein